MDSPCQVTTTVLLDLVFLFPSQKSAFWHLLRRFLILGLLEAGHRFSSFEFPSQPFLKVPWVYKMGLLPVRGLRVPPDCLPLFFITSLTVRPVHPASLVLRLSHTSHAPPSLLTRLRSDGPHTRATYGQWASSSSRSLR